MKKLIFSGIILLFSLNCFTQVPDSVMQEIIHLLSKDRYEETKTYLIKNKIPVNAVDVQFKKRFSEKILSTPVGFILSTPALPFLMLDMIFGKKKRFETSILYYTSLRPVSPERNLFIDYLLEKGANPNLGNNFPLEAATTMGDKDLVTKLLAKNANPQLVGGRLLTLAWRAGEKELFELYLNKKVDPNKGLHSLDDSPLLAVIDSADYEALDKLYKLGANPLLSLRMGYDNILHEMIIRSNERMLKDLHDRGFSFKKQKEMRACPTEIAVRHCNVSLVKKILDYGADKDCEADFGESLLHSIASSQNPDATEIMALFIDGRSLDIKTEFEEETPLHLALLQGNASLMTLLVKSGANPKIKNKEGKSPLDLAYKRYDNASYTWKPERRAASVEMIRLLEPDSLSQSFLAMKFIETALSDDRPGLEALMKQGQSLALARATFPNHPDDLLLSLVKLKKLDMLEFLLENGGDAAAIIRDIDRHAYDYWTPIKDVHDNPKKLDRVRLVNLLLGKGLSPETVLNKLAEHCPKELKNRCFDMGIDIFEIEKTWPQLDSMRRIPLLIPYQEKGKWGIVDYRNKKVTEAVYEKVEICPNLSGKREDALVAVQKDGLRGYYHYILGELISPDFHAVNTQGIPAIMFNDKWYLLDETFKPRRDPLFEALGETDPASGLTAARKRGKWGYIRPDGSDAISIIYREVLPIRCEVAVVKDKDGWKYLNTQGKVLAKGLAEGKACSCERSYAYMMTDTLYQISAGNLRLQKGSRSPIPEFSIPSNYETWRTYNLKHISFMEKLFFSKKYNRVLKQYETYFDLPGGLVAVKKDRKWGIYNYETEELIHPLTLTHVKANYGLPLISVKHKRKWGLLSLDGIMIVPADYDELKVFDHSTLIAAKKGDSWDLYSGNAPQLELIAQAQQDIHIQDGLIFLKNNNKWTVQNAKGKVIIPGEYESRPNPAYGCFFVVKNGQAFYTDTWGRVYHP